MASATATATMAAAGFDKRSSSGSSSLQTPGSGGFPSEMRSPLAGSPGFLKQRENDLKTPITPPSAYLDFLKNMSPAMMSPAPTSTSARFSFNGDKYSDKSSTTSTEKPSISPPTSQPALSRNTSYDSTASTSSVQSTATGSSASSTGTRRQRPESPRVTIPPSPFAMPAPRSSRTPRKLTIPQSPFSAGMPSAGMPSARSIGTPYTSTPLSAAPWSASFSPRDVDTETNGKPGKVTVKQVVTRTFTYCRTPLEAIPDGNLWKRRKVEHEETSKESSEEPRVKEESTGSESEDTKTAVPVGSFAESTTSGDTKHLPKAKDA